MSRSCGPNRMIAARVRPFHFLKTTVDYARFTAKPKRGASCALRTVSCSPSVCCRSACLVQFRPSNRLLVHKLYTRRRLHPSSEHFSLDRCLLHNTAQLRASIRQIRCQVNRDECRWYQPGCEVASRKINKIPQDCKGDFEQNS